MWLMTVVTDMSVMQVVLRHPYAKFEVHTPSCSKDMAHFWSRVKQPADLDL